MVYSVSGSSSALENLRSFVSLIFLTASTSISSSPSVSIAYGYDPVLVIVEVLRGNSVDLNRIPSLLTVLRCVGGSISGLFCSVASSLFIVFQ